MVNLCWFLAGTLIVWGLTRMFLRYAESRALIDLPNERSSHVQPTPRGGGLPMVLFFLGALGIFKASELLGTDEFIALFGGTILVAGIGFVDDHRHVAARWRLLVHFAAAFWSLFWIGGFPPLLFGDFQVGLGFLGFPVGALFLVWLLNLFNFMDGIDGIAGCEAIFISLTAAFVCGNGASLSELIGDSRLLLVLASACLGFLIWNWPPAAIFMGDVGSGFLGFILGLMALITIHHGIVTIWFWLILFGVFISDATVTLVRRTIRGERWHEAHRSHAYQHAARRLGSHRTVTLAVLAIDIVWLLPLALAAWAWPSSGLLLACVALAPLVIFAFRYDAGVV